MGEKIKNILSLRFLSNIQVEILSSQLDICKHEIQGGGLGLEHNGSHILYIVCETMGLNEIMKK